MKKLTILCFCLILLSGCGAFPRIFAQESAPKTAAPVEVTLPPEAVPSPVPATLPPRPTDEPSPAPTAAPTAEPTAALSTQTCAGTYFRFDAPEDWLRSDMQDGVCLFPDASDTRHTFLLYQEADNSLGLTETAVDVALFLSPKKTVTDLVARALTESGMTDFTLSPVSVKKTELNGSTCYRGQSTVTVSGEAYEFEGHVFLQGDSMVLLIWAGDEARYAEGLAAVYDSFQALK